MTRLRLYNDIRVVFEVPSNLFIKPATVAVEFLHRGEFCRKNLKIRYFHTEIQELDTSTDSVKRYSLTLNSNIQKESWLGNEWVVRIMLLDENANAFYTTQYNGLFEFALPIEGEELSSELSILVGTPVEPPVPEGLNAYQVEFDSEGLNFEATTVQEAISELSKKIVYVD